MSSRARLLLSVVAILAIAGIAAGLFSATRDGATPDAEQSADYIDAGGFLAGESPETGEGEDEPELEDLLSDAYRQRSFPQEGVGLAQAVAARTSFQALPLRVPAAQGFRATSALSLSVNWRSLGPTIAEALPSPFGRHEVRPATVSGRVSTLLLSPRCVPGDCRLWAGAAGGGVFRTDDALAEKPAWRSKSNGLTSSAIGSLARDPSDSTGRTIYVGTGESHATGDAEAGLGVFRSTDGGDTWSLLAGSPAVASGSAVSGIVVDPRNPRTIYISTARSGHGRSSVPGGEAAPPGAPPYGVYRSVDGGATFAPQLSVADDSSDESTTKSVNQIALDPNDPDTLYAAVVGEGLFRRSQTLDGSSEFHQVFAFRDLEIAEDSLVVFSPADLGASTRIYLGAASPNADNPVSLPDWIFDDRGVANLYRIDDANLPAAEVLDGWTLLSSTEHGTPGFSSFRYCHGQCDYNNVVASPPGQPDVVWLGGQFDYKEAASGASAGRAVQRSSDAGVSFSDVTSDARIPLFQIHPDEHAIVFSPNDPDIAFIGSDGGVVRTSGRYASVAGRCARDLEPALFRWCRQILGQAPTRIDSLNEGLDTLQLHSVSVSGNPQSPELLIGTQDNGTWSYAPSVGWRSIAGGDGGQSGVDVKDPRIRFHTFFTSGVRINHSALDPTAWRAIYAPLRDVDGRATEYVSFYMPIIADPRVGGTIFIGMQHVWRTQKSGGPREQIVSFCDDDKVARLPSFCGDWVPLGPDLTSTAFGDDRRDQCDEPRKIAKHYCFVAAVERAPGDTGTLWAATFPGRVFVSKNADGPPNSVAFERIDVPTGTPGGASTPGRFVSGIAIDPENPNHAWISYSGYDAYTPSDQRGHVFEVVFNGSSQPATWTNRSYNLEDEPITDIVHDPTTGDLYASTDFGVTRLPAGATAWTEAASGLPFVAVYGLTLSPDSKSLYAATHGRGLWALELR